MKYICVYDPQTGYTYSWPEHRLEEAEYGEYTTAHNEFVEMFGSHICFKSIDDPEMEEICKKLRSRFFSETLYFSKAEN